jgi:phosphoenolpyruvate---glycerone phosphotransferase subunit DhaL
MDQILKKKLITAMANAVISHADELTTLDQAIGDGDHGLNMKRGFEAVLAEVDPLSTMPLAAGMKALGTHLVMKVGGASGPLYGTLFMSMGKDMPENPTVHDVAQALAAGIEALKARGKSEPGQKTMLDVLVPVQAALQSGGTGAAAKRVAAQAADATIPMKAIKGRASFLGERSVGHMDPGARSSALIIAALCDAVE